MLIADLSESNPNVFYELAIRHGLKKPFIHMIDASEAIPFDNAQVRTIQIDLSDLDSVDAAKRELARQIDSIESGESVSESPISIAFDLESLKTSGNPDEALLANLIEEMGMIRRDIATIRRQPVYSGSRKTRTIVSASHFLDLLRVHGEEALADKIEKNFDFETLKENSITYSVKENGNFEDLDSQVESALRRITGQPWIATFLPF